MWSFFNYNRRLYRFIETNKCSAYDIFDQKFEAGKGLVKLLNVSQTGRKPKITATLFAARRPLFYIYNALFHTFIITTIAFSNYSIENNLPHFRIANSFLIILTSIMFKSAVNISLPTTRYLTLMDKYQLTNIIFICLIISWFCIVGNQTFARDWTMDYRVVIDHWSLLPLGVLFGLVQFVYLVLVLLAFWKFKKLEKYERNYFSEHKEKILDF